MYLTLSECAANADILLLPKNSGNNQYLKWIIKGSAIVNLCTNNEIKKGSLSIDITGATPEATIQANLKSDEGGQKWIARSNDVVLSQVGYEEKSGKNANQTWIPHFVDKGYSLGLHPGFPGGIDDNDDCDLSSIKDLRLGCLTSAKDRYLAKEAMRICDESMSFLVGSQLSVGTLKSIADSIQEDGPERMPGYCCMDVATNSEFWGYNVRRLMVYCY